MDRKAIIVIIGVIAFLLIAYFTHPIVINASVEAHNKKIDYSCNSNEDCTIKYVGTGICETGKFSCVNIESIEGKPDYIWPPSQITCAALELWPENCQCENNYCVNYRNGIPLR
ncbi:hypothetical protein GOV09_00600 [Candidatus Woesearchaeota archaeon]|nr:hypothetical protein [Candidatus Woesearchaeota archaeon]